MEVREVTVEGSGGPLPLTIAEAGQGGRPLVLVHGFTGAKEDFTDWLDPLAELGWHAVAPDQVGHGDSPKPVEEAAYSFDGFATDLVGLLDAMGWPTAVALGHSMGGMVVQTAVLQAPERFDGLVLMSTSHRALRADPALVEMAIGIALGQGMQALLEAQDALEKENALGNDIDRRLKAERPGYLEFSRRKLLASHPAMYAAMIRAITDRSTASIDRLEGLRGVSVPTLVLVGEHDEPFVQPSQRMAETIPGAELVVVPDAAHSPQFENPEPWWKALSRFLETL
ncbi:MAG: alpha/beta fold hydrolase [Actinomycetota bacterium]